MAKHRFTALGTSGETARIAEEAQAIARNAVDYALSKGAKQDDYTVFMSAYQRSQYWFSKYYIEHFTQPKEEAAHKAKKKAKKKSG